MRTESDSLNARNVDNFKDSSHFFYIRIDNAQKLAYANFWALASSGNKELTDRVPYCFTEERRERQMIPLTMMNTGEECIIKKIGGKEETRRFLENLGFVVGGSVAIVSDIGGNLIVNVKDSRIAIGKDMAAKIMV